MSRSSLPVPRIIPPLPALMLCHSNCVACSDAFAAERPHRDRSRFPA
jgi:hypothetical protein